jgi:tryptophan synthase alpha chain
MASPSPIISSDPLAPLFSEWREQRHTALIPYITAGYPTLAATPELLRAVADAGADLIELGVPFSDPVADGPTIQRSSQAALENGMTLKRALDALADFRRTHQTPAVVFTYLNPLLNHGAAAFARDAAAAGAQAVLVVDLPVGSDPELEDTLEQSPLALVRLLAPTTAADRAFEIMRRTQGFLYYVARLGVTGARAALRTELITELQRLRHLSADVPIAVGFGISNAEQARAIAAVADGIIVGSALIDRLDNGGIKAAADIVNSLRLGLDQER